MFLAAYPGQSVFHLVFSFGPLDGVAQLSPTCRAPPAALKLRCFKDAHAFSSQLAYTQTQTDMSSFCVSAEQLFSSVVVALTAGLIDSACLWI